MSRTCSLCHVKHQKDDDVLTVKIKLRASADRITRWTPPTKACRSCLMGMPGDYKILTEEETKKEKATGEKKEQEKSTEKPQSKKKAGRPKKRGRKKKR